MLDAIRLEKLGVPTVVLAWEIFESSCHSHAQRSGLASLPVIVVPSSTSEENFDLVEPQRADACLPRVVAGLTTQG